jgi:hypothetical protein
MTDTNAKPDLLNWEEPKKLPDMLNVLTILTFIGNGLGLLFSLYGFINARATYEKTVQMQDKMDEMPAVVKKMMGSDPVGASLRMLDNRVPILLLALVAYGLCIYGAIQMRQRKKMGFSLYILGDIVPLVSAFLFIGVGSLSGFGFLFGMAITVVFILLYASQLKHMS